MTRRLLIQLLLVAALLVSPFGRIGVGAADATGLGGHCAGMPMSHPGKAQPMTVDCTIACAAIAPAPGCADLASPALLIAIPIPLPQPLQTGLRTGTDPPPPRDA